MAAEEWPEGAMKPSNQEKIKMWYKHNELQGERPMVHLEMWTLARGCKMEITQRDVYTINNDIAKARRYVQIIKQEIVNLW